MKVSGIILAAIFGLGGFCGAAFADNGLVFSEQNTAVCFAESELISEKRECISRSADACANANDLGRSTIGVAGCLSLELEYWDKLLNEVYQGALQTSAQIDIDNEVKKHGMLSSADTLRDMQRAWIIYRDARCLYETSTWGQGTGASGAHTACLMVTTAEQAIFLSDVAGVF